MNNLSTVDAGRMHDIEFQFRAMKPKFGELLPATVTPDRFVRSLLMSVEKTPKLMNCDFPTLVSAAMSAAVLGLECDGATGQAFILPYGRRAQLIIGYKGYNTMAARSGWTITSSVVREGDEFDYQTGSHPYINHKPTLGGEPNRRLIGVWATARHNSQPPIVLVMSIDEVEQVKQKSAAKNRSDSPWNDAGIGYAAMAEKTARRRLARSMPLNTMVLASAMEEAHEERGLLSYIDERGKVITDESQVIEEAKPNEPVPVELPPKFELYFADGKTVGCEDIIEFVKKTSEYIGKAIDAGKLDAFMDKNKSHLGLIALAYPKEMSGIVSLLDWHGVKL